jgi:ubiquinone/menaquinone biosynthesis C-methylase UbiE
MKPENEEIVKKQKENWDSMSVGWKKWDNLVMEKLRPLVEAILQPIQWKEDFIVLDIACGTGEPGISAAELVKRGKVFGTDLSDKMLSLASEKALIRGLNNYETRVCSVYELPFPDKFFDVVLCRLGFMFFPDILEAVNEIKRVLKPGGEISACVWGSPEKNFWATNMIAIKQFIEIPPPKPDAPGMFRCAAPGFLKGFFEQAGLQNISEIPVDFEQNFDSLQFYWEFYTEVANIDILNNSDEITKEKVKSKVFEYGAKYLDETGLTIPSYAIVVKARK